MKLPVPKMRTASKIVLILFVLTSTMLYCVMNHEHDKYSKDANSGDPHSDSVHKEEVKPDAQCDGQACDNKATREDKQQLSKMDQVMKDNRLSEHQKKNIVDQLRAEMSHYADMPEYSELKRQWDEEARERLQDEARKRRDEKKAAEKEKESVSVTGVEGPMMETIHLAVVACGDRMEETLIMLKSATLFTKAPMKFHIFTDEELKPQFSLQLTGWPDFVREKFTFQLYNISFPGVSRPDLWIKFFKPCACQRIFLPYILEKVEKLIYVDTDILFFIPLDDLWQFFSRFNSTHISALAPEHEQPWMGWYNRFARHPYYGKLGVNSGVMLMNLQDMRDSQWLPLMDDYFKLYRLNMTWGDQDLINVFFHFYPEKLYVYPCEWNFRPDHCMYGSVCKSAEQAGVRVVHGNRGVYHNEKQPLFKAIYNTIKEYSWGGSPDTGLVQVLEHKFQEQELKDTYCGKSSELFTKGLQKTVDQHKEQNKR